MSLPKSWDRGSEILGEGVDSTNERIDGILSRMAEEFRDLRAVIRLSFGELDGRVRALE